MDILFVVGFFLVLLFTGVSLVGVMVALLVATLVMFAGGLFVFVIKLLPWLLLALVIAGVYRVLRQPGCSAGRWRSRL